MGSEMQNRMKKGKREEVRGKRSQYNLLNPKWNYPLPPAPYPLLFVLALLLICAMAMGQKKPPKPALARGGRDTLSLDGGNWRGASDENDSGEKSGWQKALPNEARTLAIPETLTAPPTGSAWRWREFTVPARWKGQTIRLQFGAVSEIADVWLNGETVGAHSGGVLPFEFNVTKILHLDGKNLLAIRLRSEFNQPVGIGQSVLLAAHDEAYLQDAFPQAGRAGNLSVPATLFNASDKSGDSELDADIFDPATPKKFIVQSKQNLSVSPGRNVTTLTLNARKKTFLLWTPQKPQLYTLALNFHQGADSLDTLQVRFGFREWGYKDGAITLNGAAITLKSAPYSASALAPLVNPDAQNRLRAAFSAFRASGVNLLYTEAADPILLQIADETGMLIIEGPRSNLPPAVAYEELRGLIVRDRAHACVFGWNLGELHPAGIAPGRDLDPTRFLLTGAGASARIIPPNTYLPYSLPMP